MYLFLLCNFLFTIKVYDFKTYLSVLIRVYSVRNYDALIKQLILMKIMSKTVFEFS